METICILLFRCFCKNWSYFVILQRKGWSLRRKNDGARSYHIYRRFTNLVILASKVWHRGSLSVSEGARGKGKYRGDGITLEVISGHWSTILRLTHLNKSNIFSTLSEALSAHVKVVLSDNSTLIGCQHEIITWRLWIGGCGEGLKGKWKHLFDLSCYGFSSLPWFLNMYPCTHTS